MDAAVQISVSLALALLWLMAAARKAADFRAFCATVREYRVLPRMLALPAATIVIGLEAALGVALLSPTARSLGLVVSAGLLALYALVMSVNLLRGRRHIDCGCMGPASQQPLSEWVVGRNLALAAAALAGALPVEPRALLWVDVFSIVATIAVLAALYATLNRLFANARDLTSLGR